ncbi:DEAD/DEAH box helicase family protein [Shewanella sp. SG44-6]|jgi:ATP-dependent DNA helicase RecG|uniref:helicase-related protein n=1 Tax=Shewanella sp. SG44-6 TaxID=2760959 RepID=UPI00160331FE|nr:helicase-related protein [Shewanella sp. SG44-6]MBB1389477.1 DEAD/DEAH box helicase family protein [Shewanella sp. SG44-6]
MLIPNALKSIGIQEMWQLPMVMPHKYSNNNYVVSDFCHFSEISLEMKILCRGTLLSCSQVKYMNNKAPFVTIQILDVNGNSLQTNIFGTGAVLTSFLGLYKQGDIVHLSGKPVFQRGQWMLNNSKALDVNELYRINVSYSLSYKNKSLPSSAIKFVVENIHSSINLTCDAFTDFFKSKINRNQILNNYICIPLGLTLREILTEIHFPTDVDLAVEYQGYIEKLAALLTAEEVRSTALKWGKARTKIVSKTYFERSKQLSFSMTHEQFDCVDKLSKLFDSDHSQKAMLIGDVGTGKSCVMQVLAASFCDAGGRVVFLAPSQNLANQLYDELLGFFPDLNPKLVIDGVKVDWQRSKTSRLWVGTTSLFFQDWHVPFDLVIVDEQQRYSVEQRETLCKGGGHLLESTATPIPRSAALLKHGFINQFHLTECFTEKELISKIHYLGDRKYLFERTLSNLKAGNKLLVICALKSDSDSNLMANITSAEKAYISWQKFVDKYRQDLPIGTSVGISHSGQSNEDNTKAINNFKNGDINILISTTIVETGLTVPDLNQIIVLNPERLGLVQHHQLRGRLARFGGIGFYDLYCNKQITDRTLARLELVCSSTSGLHLAFEDIKQRGFGNLSSESRTNSKAQKGVLNSYIYGRSVSPEALDSAVAFSK